ncbi:hypothetical protein A3731_31780, partial [Roseovarius sp. HI0049]
MSFSDKVALITGAGNGIGKAAAKAFAKQGARIVAVDLNGEAARSTAEEILKTGGTAISISADVSEPAAVKGYVEATLERFGRIDCFFNNAGIEGQVALIADTDETMFDRIMAINLKGVFLGLKYVIPVMTAQNSGAIVNTSSISGIAGSVGLCAYSASKHGVISLTRTAASEIGRQGVRVNAICPGPTDTRMIRSLADQRSGGSADATATYSDLSPIGRFASPSEIADFVVYLCSDKATYFTASHHMVDGGYMASLPTT